LCEVRFGVAGTRIWSFFVKLETICKKFGDHPKSQKFRPKKSPSPTTKSKSHHHLLTHLSQLLPNRFRQPPPLSLTTSSYFRINIRHISATIPSFVPPSTSTIETPFSCFRALSIPYFFSQTLHCSHATHSPLHPNLITTLIYCEHFILRPTIAAQTRISEPDFNSSPTCQISHIMPTLMPLPFPGSVHPKLDGLSVVPRILRRGSPMERSSSQQIYATALSFCRFLFTTLSFQKSSFQ
jgi:hypothetical protein